MIVIQQLESAVLEPFFVGKQVGVPPIFTILAVVVLVMALVPFNKVNNYERAEIINNVRKCISDNFNASMVEFGEGINYDELVKAIDEEKAKAE